MAKRKTGKRTGPFFPRPSGPGTKIKGRRAPQTEAQRNARALGMRAMKRARLKHPKGRLPPGALKEAFAEERRGAPGGAAMARRPGRNAIVPMREQPFRDNTPRRADPRPLGPAFTMRLDAVPVIRTQPDDVLAMSAALLFALRSVAVGLRGVDQAEREQILSKWFQCGDTGVMGCEPGVNLSDEVKFFHELFRAIPDVARAMNFTGSEWINAWNIIAGPAIGVLPAGPAVSPGLDGLYPPVVGTVTSPFGVGHHGVDIAAAWGAPIVAPEDLLITKISTDADGFGLHIVGVSRRPLDGTYPRIAAGGGGTESIVPAEGERRHLFGHLSSLSAGLKRGDQVERGATIGTVGSSGKSTGPHLHWRVDLWTKDLEGKIKLLPMDPADLVPLDVVSGSAAVRPPAASWTVEDTRPSPDGKAGTMRELPSYNIWIGGDLINKGGKISTGDIDVLSLPVEEPTSEFDEIDSYGKLAEKLLGGVGGIVGGIYGGNTGSKIGSGVGKGLGRIGTDVIGDMMKQDTGRRRAR